MSSGGQEGNDVNSEGMFPANGLTVNNDGSGLCNHLIDMAASLSFLALIAVLPGMTDRFGRS
jgi:hypothetical protein